MTERSLALVRVPYDLLAKALGLRDGLRLIDVFPGQWSSMDEAIYLKLEGPGLFTTNPMDVIAEVGLKDVIVTEPLARLVALLEECQER